MQVETKPVETKPETTPVPIGQIVHELGETIQKEANVRTVFGDPVELDTHRIVPVAMVTIGLGGGGGGGRRASKEGGFGGVGGMSVVAVPVGFLAEKEGVVTFTPIEVAHAHNGEGLQELIKRLVTRATS